MMDLLKFGTPVNCFMDLHSIGSPSVLEPNKKKVKEKVIYDVRQLLVG
jgi:hypothetical protein